MSNGALLVVKRPYLEARVASAKSNKEVQDLIAGSSTSSALSAFEAMEEKVLTMESEGEAMGRG
jgi:phage shock protein A